MLTITLRIVMLKLNMDKIIEFESEIKKHN